MRKQAILPPGARIGILGGGQLGRMTALAASYLGYQTHIFAPDPEAPAFQVTPFATKAAYEDQEALADFTAQCDGVTLEFENIPLETLRFIEEKKPLYPASNTVAITQDRVLEKTFLNNQNVKTTDWAVCSALSDIDKAVEVCGLPAILKTARLGYDGKGQYYIDSLNALKDALQKIGGEKAILERIVDFQCEVSVLVARDQQGKSVIYPVIENTHADHILVKSRVPARITPEQSKKAQEIAFEIGEKLSLCGLIAVEMFYCGGEVFLVNEIAPRPHNSGHWTIEGAITSQFSQLVRIVAGLPLGSGDALCRCEMYNVMGGGEEKAIAMLSQPHSHLHLYGKNQSRPQRKMGHVTRLFPEEKI